MPSKTTGNSRGDLDRVEQHIERQVMPILQRLKADKAKKEALAASAASNAHDSSFKNNESNQNHNIAPSSIHSTSSSPATPVILEKMDTPKESNTFSNPTPLLPIQVCRRKIAIYNSDYTLSLSIYISVYAQTVVSNGWT